MSKVASILRGFVNQYHQDTDLFTDEGNLRRRLQVEFDVPEDMLMSKDGMVVVEVTSSQ